ncbi:MAG TPA: small multi-drug export protein [Candidatus Methanoculleus thermohydrogenotrophicum]|jgi:uncharacterized membrane protein|nr:small multi-drug export protein [Candidatus Methanoculleus thermohydrogenotrophicum]HOB17687.1 small multi-drug export protein [Candidatus Methanoculleus thermohydrogenotrophicum]HPZ37291.1 small multi-drug export protein [Candidatus Methanoculleus thermohydrogenotrophicum]HQC92048.1 small multi-drug export protein [Candidatus Methanoculleus thermohydrogenotrophicum]
MTSDPDTTIQKACWWKAVTANPYVLGSIKFVLPFAIVLAVFVPLYLIVPYEDFLTLSGLAVAYFIPPAGKESIIPIAIMMGYPWWLITLVIFLIDVAVALFVVWNFDLALKIPLIGRLLEGGMTVARNYIETQPLLRRLSAVGLILFVFFPFQGTGTMNGSILGRLLGMDEAQVLSCVCIGSLASCLVIALGTDAILDVYRMDPVLGIMLLILVTIVVVAVVAGWWMWKGRLRRRRRPWRGGF